VTLTLGDADGDS